MMKISSIVGDNRAGKNAVVVTKTILEAFNRAIDPKIKSLLLRGPKGAGKTTALYYIYDKKRRMWCLFLM